MGTLNDGDKARLVKKARKLSQVFGDITVLESLATERIRRVENDQSGYVSNGLDRRRSVDLTLPNPTEGLKSLKPKALDRSYSLGSQILNNTSTHDQDPYDTPPKGYHYTRHSSIKRLRKKTTVN